MSLAKFITASFAFLQKDVISFLVVRRFDLKSNEDLIRYIAVRRNASIATLRQKVWHLLDLPDYCDEVLILKTSNNIETPLTELRKGNQPNQPFILEVWPPEKNLATIMGPKLASNMLTMVHKSSVEDKLDRITESQSSYEKSLEKFNMEYSTSTLITEKSAVFNRLHNRRNLEHRQPMNVLPSEFKTRDLPKRISNTSIFNKLQGKKSKENLTNVILKIQSELSNLSDKLTNLENKIPAQD